MNRLLMDVVRYGTTSVFFLTIFVVQSVAQVSERHVLTLEGAKQIAGVAEQSAKGKGARVVIAVVDDSGNRILLRRLDDTQVASVNVAIDKARTASIYRRPSKDFEDQVTNGRVSAMALNGAVALQGGIPITFDGKVIGAIGVSGETPKIDEDIAIAGSKVAQLFKAR